MAYTSVEKKVPLSQLYLDPNNYRFIDNPDYKKIADIDIVRDDIQRRTRDFIQEKNQDGIKDLIASFKANGYLPVDMIQARELGENKYLVIEGNRRLTTLKFLQEECNRSRDIGKFDISIFENVPITLYQDADEKHHLIVMGLKHISGNKKWASINQAKYIKELINTGISKEEIRESLGVTTVQINRYLRALSLIEQYQASDFGEHFGTDKFTMFDEIIKQPKIRQWLLWDDIGYKALHSVNTERLFSWISPSEIEEGDLRETRKREPIITRSEDIRKLAEFIDNDKMLNQMEEDESIWKVLNSSSYKNKNTQAKVEEAISDLKSQAYEVRRFADVLSEENKEVLQKTYEEIKETLHKQGQLDVLDDEGIRRNIYADLTNTTHFSEILIQKAKHFSATKIVSLQKINIFAGINNAGKTTLLEAVYFLLKQNDLYAYFDIQHKRAKQKNSLPFVIINKFFNGWEIEGTYFDNTTKVAIQQKQSSNGRLSTIEANAIFGDIHTQSEVQLYAHRANIVYESIGNVCKVVFSSPFSALSWKEISRAYEISLSQSSYSTILSFIKQNIDPQIKDIRLTEAFDASGFLYFFVEHEIPEKSTSLTNFGEGLQRIFLIALQFAAAKNGVLLIDEFENAIHHNLMEKFVPLIMELSNKFNVQVFLTTHSLECIDTFLQQEKYDIMSFYRLENNKQGNIACKYQSGKDYATLRNNFGIDLRG